MLSKTAVPITGLYEMNWSQGLFSKQYPSPMEPPSLEGNLHGEDRNPVPLPNHWDTKLEPVPYWEGGSSRAL